MNKFIIIQSIIGIFLIIVPSLWLGLLPLTYGYPAGTQLREMVPITIIGVLFLCGVAKFLQHFIKALSTKCLTSFCIAIFYLVAGISGQIAFIHSYKVMGYSMAD